MKLSGCGWGRLDVEFRDEMEKFFKCGLLDGDLMKGVAIDRMNMFLRLSSRKQNRKAAEDPMHEHLNALYKLMDRDR